MKKILFIAFAGALFAFLGFRIYQETSGSPADAENFNSGRRGTLVVEVTRPEPYGFQISLEVLGELEPFQQVNVTPRVGGYLETITVQRSDSVKRGDLIAVVDDDNIEQQIRRAEAAVAVAQAGVARDEAAFENTRLQVRRNAMLQAKGLIAQQDIDETESRLRSTQAVLELSRAQVQQAEASLSELKVQQEQTRIYSPLSGLVAERLVDPGALVNSNNPIVTIVDISRVKIIVQVPESNLPQVRVGLPAQVVVDAYPDLSYRGRVARISPTILTETRTADVEIEIPNENHVLRPGMFVRVGLGAQSRREALSIPRSALLTRGSQRGVYLLGEDLTAVFTPIETGLIEGNRVEVISGLTGNQTVITSGAQSLNDGDSVRLADGGDL